MAQEKCFCFYQTDTVNTVIDVKGTYFNVEFHMNRIGENSVFVNQGQ